MSNMVPTRHWHTVAEVADMLGYGETKVRMAILSGDLKSVKDGKLRRILPEWVDQYVALEVAESGRPLMARRHNGEGTIYPYRKWLRRTGVGDDSAWAT
ncbi:excisionase family DNA-binding protein [Janibacter melonis]|uniref:excisionase family DNA-binding protein n=1 Tax=Janibacter melonis TaxID=262209 RepID=UPI0009FD7332|nr:excisionase family DNA-binding protein [Janibacter melonis]